MERSIGSARGAMRVDLKPPAWATHLLSDLTDWQRCPVPVAEIEPSELPDDVYFEYAYLDHDGNRREDPDNPNPRLNPYWKYACNLAGADYRPGRFARLGPGRPAGTVRRRDVASSGFGRRHYLIYSPAGYANTTLPLILFQDGKAYFGWGKAPRVLDHLLAADLVSAAHLVFVPPVARTREYAFNDSYLEFLVEELLPDAERQVPCDGRRAAWGASLGGLLSANLAWRYPELFQTVVAQSGAFNFDPRQDPDDPFGGASWFVEHVATSGRQRPLRWYLTCGTLEWLIDSNRRLAEVLRDQGYDVALHERHAGHNWVNWNDGFSAALLDILGRWRRSP